MTSLSESMRWLVKEVVMGIDPYSGYMISAMQAHQRSMDEALMQFQRNAVLSGIGAVYTCINTGVVSEAESINKNLLLLEDV